ncbi:hypothetical protein ACFSKU_21705 [Pontibacter silvestris]|uniref:Four helix bundle protein n=1 Tax=Pontibacter silvestris TaxID=2305183 RepID=A0ABW4X4I7_9BACT|nr:hypothetical protein [Pontibacter silvestris]MCC9138336.1 hypothetical protein [Pontibacter silvestris]
MPDTLNSVTFILNIAADIEILLLKEGVTPDPVNVKQAATARKVAQLSFRLLKLFNLSDTSAKELQFSLVSI